MGVSGESVSVEGRGWGGDGAPGHRFLGLSAGLES